MPSMQNAATVALERRALRAHYESALRAHQPEIAAQIREAFLQEAGAAPEPLVLAATQSLIESLLQAPDEALAAYFGEEWPEHLRHVPGDQDLDQDLELELLRRFNPDLLH